MKLVDRSEILPLGEYEAIRDRFRARVIEEKRARRVALGDVATCMFENHDTVLLQVQEMLRTERITKTSAIKHELETYNTLVPKDDEVSVTMMIEIADTPVREKFLAAAQGLEDKIAFVVDGEASPALYEKPLAPAQRTTAVHYFKFRVSAEARAKVAKGAARVELISSHPAYSARVVLSPALVRSLAEDFA